MTAPSNPSGTVVHEVRWSDALPWWLLFRAAGAAFSPTVVLLAALGAVATWAGWSACDQLGLAGSVDPAGTLARDGSLVLPPATGPVPSQPGPAPPGPIYGTPIPSEQLPPGAVIAPGPPVPIESLPIPR